MATRISTAKAGAAQLSATIGYFTNTQQSTPSTNTASISMSGSGTIVDAEKAPPPTFFVVHYGANKRLLLNINCRCDMLEQTIRQKCTIPANTEFELLDPDGTVVNFGGGPQRADFLRNRCLYVIVQRLPNRSYVPLLDNFEKLHPVLCARLKEMNDKMQETPSKAPGGTQSRSRATSTASKA